MTITLDAINEGEIITEKRYDETCAEVARVEVLASTNTIHIKLIGMKGITNNFLSNSGRINHVDGGIESKVIEGCILVSEGDEVVIYKEGAF